MVKAFFAVPSNSFDFIHKVHEIPYKDGVAGSSPVPPTLRVKSEYFHQKVQPNIRTGMGTGVGHENV